MVNVLPAERAIFRVGLSRLQPGASSVSEIGGADLVGVRQATSTTLATGDRGRVPESWVGKDVLVLLDPDAKAGLLPPQPGQELTVTLAGVGAEGALLTHQFTDPNTGGTQRGRRLLPLEQHTPDQAGRTWTSANAPYTHSGA